MFSDFTWKKNFVMFFLLGLSNLPRIIVACDFSSSSLKVKRGTLPLLQNRYPNLRTTSHIKLRELLESLLLATYLISAAVTLRLARFFFTKKKEHGQHSSVFKVLM